MDSEGDATGALCALSAKGHGRFRPQGLFRELGGLREAEAQELWQVQKEISVFVLLLGLGAEGNQICSVDENFPPTSLGFVFAQRWEYWQYHFIEASRC